MICASKLFLLVISFLVPIYRFSKPQNRLKSCFACPFLTHDTIQITNEVNTSHFQSELNIFIISIFRFKNDNSFYPLLLLLSGDISLNLGPFSNRQLFKLEEWQAFSNRRLHLINLNINSLLPKIDELRDIAKRTKASVIGISESTLKIMKFFFSIEISMEEVLIVTLEVTLAINWIIFCQMELKISHSIFWCHRQNQSQLELFKDPPLPPQISLDFLIFFKKIYPNSTQGIVKFTS